MKRKIIMLVGLFLCAVVITQANSYSLHKETLEQVEMLGNYTMAYASSSSVYGCEENIHGFQPIGTPYRLPGDNGGRIFVQDPNGGTYGGGGNSSSSNLSKPTANSKIVRAYLVEEMHYMNEENVRVMVDYPMRLVAPSGRSVYANSNKIYGSANSIGVTVSDVTDFVIAEGFGTYQGWDIPYYNRNYRISDQNASWKLVVVCEDESIPLRLLRLKFGGMSTSGAVINVAIDGQGIKTKESGNVTGQILIGGTGGDPDWHGSHFDLSPKSSASSVRLSTGTSGNLNRPDNFFEGLVVQNGNQRSDTAVVGYRNTDNTPVNNNDMILLDANTVSSNAQNGHNAYFMNNSDRMTLTATTTSANGNLSVFGMAVDIDSATYRASMSHSPITAKVDEQMSITTSIQNNSATTKYNLGLSGGSANLTLDSDLQIDQVSATFTARNGTKTVIPPNAISILGKNIKVRYGADANAYSKVGDQLDIVIKATPQKEKSGYNNRVDVTGTGLIDETGTANPMGQSIKVASATNTFVAINPPTITASDKTFFDSDYDAETWLNTVRMKNVSAKDDEDGNLTSKIKVTYDNTKVNTAGTYKVTYSVTDSNSTTTTKDVVITVVYNNPPVISKVDREFYEGEYTSEEWYKNIRMKNITASDKEDGNLTTKIKIISDRVDVSVPGIYEVKYEVTDSHHKIDTKISKVKVKFNNPPVITAPSYSFYEDEITKKQWNKDYLMKDVSADDIEDGDLTNDIEIDFNNVDPTIPGKYQVIYSVEDQYGKGTKKTTDIEIKYNTPPKITAGNKRFMENEYTQKEWEEQIIKDNITASDVEDGDITKEIKILEDDVDMSIPGFYRVLYEVSDRYGKKDKKSIEVEIVYNQIPMIHAENKSYYEGELTNQKWLEEEILKDVTAIDSEDGTLSEYIEIVENNVDVAMPGSYEVTYKAVDSGNKEALKTIDVSIKPNQEPTLAIFAENKRFIEGQYTMEEWIQNLCMENVLATDFEDNVITDKIIVIKDNVKPDKAGKYKVTYKVTDQYGKSVEETIQVTVEPNLPPIIHATERWFTTKDTIDEKELLKKVIAYDDIDGEITDKVIIAENTVKQGIVGDYTVTYKVVDSLGKETIVTIPVHISEPGGEPLPPIDPPITPPYDDNAVIFANGRKKGVVELEKILEHSDVLDKPTYDKVVFGVYSDEDIYANGILVLRKDSLIDILYLNSENKGIGHVSHAGNYYVKEIATDGQYIMSDEKFEFEFIYEE